MGQSSSPPENGANGNESRCDSTSSETSDPEREPTTERLVEATSADTFDTWYREREFRRNIRQGTPYFNGPSPSRPPERHSPSSLLQCHRKILYRDSNAPEETSDPRGIFWVGSRFEEEIAVPYLRQAVTGTEEYVTNSLWVDFTERTEAGDIRIKGETDPVIVDAESEPLLLTEIKTKESVDDLTSPNEHHLAQAHAYMKGLSEKYDRQVTDALILYGSRKSLDIRAFHVEFDPWFWTESVLQWAEANTRYRIDGELPPADPEFGWECSFCSYRERCGEGETDYTDVGPQGLIPAVDDYPREKLVDYLESHQAAKLTPVLAEKVPELAHSYGTYDWECDRCGETYRWTDIDVDEGHETRCPACESDGRIGLLSGPDPATQLALSNEQSPEVARRER